MTKQSRYERLTCATRLPRRRLRTPRKDSLVVAVLLTVSALIAPAQAQTYPTKPVRIIVGFPAGGATDVVARTISQKLGEALGQSVVVDNRAGAASNIGIPTIAEAGVPGYDANAWFGIFAPAGTPQAIVNRLNSEIVKIVKLPETRDRFLALGAEPLGSTAEQFGGFFRNEVAKWAKVVKESGAQVD